GPNLPFVFIHINKCAGTSVGRAIGLPVKQHLTARDVIDRIGKPAWASAYRFTVVRNPWDKVVSHYKHRVATNQTGLGDGSVPFSDWVRQTYGPDKNPRLYDNPKMFLPNVDWLKDHDGNVDIDLIGRFEDLAGFYEAVSARLGLQGGTLPHLNGTAKTDYRAAYDAATAEWVGAWFAEDVTRFGYTFDPRPAAGPVTSG
ncbi:MAG: hypothetical protein JWO31_488, partial [Phycisphaerales bacterium]|nr:hypothetical protein [Phycisphaerales bacterium]